MSCGVTKRELALALLVAQLHQHLDRLPAVGVVHVDVKLVEHAEGRLAKLHIASSKASVVKAFPAREVARASDVPDEFWS